MPVIISLEDSAPLEEICRLCREFNMIPVGVRELDSGGGSLRQQAISQGLALMSINRGRKNSGDRGRDTPLEKGGHPKKKGDQTTPAQVGGQSPRNDKIVTTHIRSGQQVYAAGGDLIVTAPVSPGAEILADGNIHVYGPLRGRALAGVQGDTSARVFCQSLEAELISVAGHFKVNEDFRDDHWKVPAHVYLENQTLCIAPLHAQPPLNRE